MNSGSGFNGQSPQAPNGDMLLPVERKTIVGIIMFIALLAFEVFNFDTTRFALANLLGDVRFLGMQWAAILAIAFCAIDFAGLARLFTPQEGKEEPQVVWYLMGAWLLGATMNAMMTWWAISLTLLSHEFGNEVLSREQLLTAVPIFVATLVWLTRILFIGAFSIAGERIFDLAGTRHRLAQQLQRQPVAQAKRPMAAKPVRTQQLRQDEDDEEAENGRSAPRPMPPAATRIQRRPLTGVRPQQPAAMQAKRRNVR